MGIIQDQSIRNTFWIYTGVFLGYVNLLIMMPYAFSTDQIGLIRTLQSFVVLIASFTHLGIPSIILRYLPQYKHHHSEFKSFIRLNTAILAIGILMIVTLLVAFSDPLIALFSDNTGLFSSYYYFAIPIIVFVTISHVLIAYQNSYYRTVLPKFYQDVLLRLLLFLSIGGFLLFGLHFFDFLLLFLLTYAIVFLLHLFSGLSVYRKNTFSDPPVAKSNLNKKEILTYGFYSLLGTGGSMIVAQIDALMVASLKDLSSAGIYSIAFFIGLLVEIPRRAMSQTINPLISNAWNREDLGYIKDTYKKTSITQFIMGLFITICIWINLDSLFELIPNGAIFSTASLVVLFIMISKLFDMLTSINNEIIGYSKYYRFNIKALLFLIVFSFLTNLIFIPKYGLNGAAFASLLSYFLFNVTKMAYIWIRFRMQPFSLNTLSALGIAILAYLMVSVIPVAGIPLLDILIRCLFVLLLFGLPVYYFHLSPDINELTKKLLQRFFIHKK